MAGEEGVTYFGTSAPFLMACRKDGLAPGEIADLSALRGLGSTGAPLPADGFRYVYESVSPSVHLQSGLGRNRCMHGLRRGLPAGSRLGGRDRCRHLGCAVEAFSPDGRPLSGEQGELVITKPHALDARRLLERSGWCAVPGRLLRRVSRRLASRRLDHLHRTWLMRDHRPLSMPPSIAAACGSGRRSSTPWWRRLPEVADSVVIHLDEEDQLILFVALRQRVWTWIRHSKAASGPHCAPASRHATCRTGSRRCPACRARSPTRSWRCRSSES